jgi:hypothetical protein
MTTEQKLEFLIDLIKKYAESEHGYDIHGDDFDYSDGGNYDDTFESGAVYGKISFARALLEKIGEPFIYPNKKN